MARQILTIPPARGVQRLFELRNANMELTSDQALTKLFSGTAYTPNYALFVCKSGAYNTACVGGVYTGASKTGNQIVTSAFSYSALTGAGKIGITQYLVAPIDLEVAQTLFLSLTTGNGAALVADIFIFGVVLD